MESVRSCLFDINIRTVVVIEITVMDVETGNHQSVAHTVCEFGQHRSLQDVNRYMPRQLLQTHPELAHV